MMIYECTDRRGAIYRHSMSSDLTAREAMERLGVFNRPWQVRRYPDGRPDLAHTVQQFEPHEVDSRNR